MFLLFTLCCATALAQTWVSQRYYGTATCTDAPFFEALARSNTCPLSPSQQQCGASIGSPPVYLQASCKSLPVPVVQGGLVSQTFSSSDCSGGFASYSTAVTNTCFRIRTGSVKYSCSASGGGVQQLFSDTACATFSSNTSLTPAGVPAGTCIPQGGGSGFYTCSSSSLMPQLLLLATVFFIIHMLD